MEERVPEIRFKGFERPWEKRQIVDVAERLDNLRIPVSENMRKKGTVPYYGANGIQDYVEGYTHDGENVLVAEDGANDLKNYPVRCVKGKIWVNNHAHVLQGKPNIANNQFLALAIHQSDIESLLVGGGRAKLNAEVLMKLETEFPVFKEQIIIGECFILFDTLIALTQQKLDQLKTFKKACLEKMFPKEGETVPEIRFKGFEGPWEIVKLGDVSDLLTGYPFESNKFADNGIKLVRGTNVKRGYLDFSDDLCEYWISSNGLEEYLLTSNDILIQMDGALIGKSFARITEKQLPALLVQRVTRVRTLKDKVNNSFIYQEIEKYFFSYIQGTKTETAVPHLSLKDIADFSIRIPSINEQEQIGSFLGSIDKLVFNLSQKLDKLKNLKKALLDKMFI